MPHHYHNSHGDLATEGHTIHWAFLYNLRVKAIFYFRDQKIRESIVKQASIRPGEKVLEVACGTGRLAMIAKAKSDASVEVYGTDAAVEMIEKARNDAAKASIDVDFRPGLVERIDFPDDTFDIVLSSFMVHHLPGSLRAGAFTEIWRVLKPGGRLLVVDFEPPKNRFARVIMRRLTSRGMMMIDNNIIPPILEQAGFVTLNMGNAGHAFVTLVSGRKPDSGKVSNTPSTDEENLEQAKNLLHQSKFDEGRAILQQMPDNATAEEWLDRLNKTSSPST